MLRCLLALLLTLPAAVLWAQPPVRQQPMALNGREIEGKVSHLASGLVEITLADDSKWVVSLNGKLPGGISLTEPVTLRVSGTGGPALIGVGSWVRFETETDRRQRMFADLKALDIIVPDAHTLPGIFPAEKKADAAAIPPNAEATKPDASKPDASKPDKTEKPEKPPVETQAVKVVGQVQSYKAGTLVVATAARETVRVKVADTALVNFTSTDLSAVQVGDSVKGVIAYARAPQATAVKLEFQIPEPLGVNFSKPKRVVAPKPAP